MQTKTISKQCWLCINCRKTFSKWEGCCSYCKSWNTIEKQQAIISDVYVHPVSKFEQTEVCHIDTGIKEINRVLGQGIVIGSFTLIGGEPGIGKSTLIMQICGHISSSGKKVIYFSGEESVHQISMRAKRLGIHTDNIFACNETHTAFICKTVQESDYDLVVIDSIQTTYDNSIPSPPSSPIQLKESCNRFLSLCKSTSKPVIITGHVTKDGEIAGPKLLEHMVDTVVYIEGERNSHLRIVRAIKNRFGPTDEIGVFEMSKHGLKEPLSLSQILSTRSSQPSPGCTCTVFTEGTRGFITDVQALACKSYFPSPIRRAIGFDQNRMTILIAVAQKILNVPLYKFDIFFSSTGGLKLSDTSCDLPFLFALLSSVLNKPTNTDTIICGEVDLSGEVRCVHGINTRLKEAKAMGYKTCILPASNMHQKDIDDFGINLVPITNIKCALALLK